MTGLKESICLVRSLIETEARLVDPSRLVLGGISQGCATSLHALLASSHKLGGYVGFCGWLPFRAQIEEMADQAGPARTQLQSRLVDFQRSVLGLETPLAAIESPIEEYSFDTPVFLGHGDDDEMVDVALGRQARSVLQKLGFEVTWKEYEQCGHWIKEPTAYDDIVAFLEEIA